MNNITGASLLEFIVGLFIIATLVLCFYGVYTCVRQEFGKPNVLECNPFKHCGNCSYYKNGACTNRECYSPVKWYLANACDNFKRRKAR